MKPSANKIKLEIMDKLEVMDKKSLIAVSNFISRIEEEPCKVKIIDKNPKLDIETPPYYLSLPGKTYPTTCNHTPGYVVNVRVDDVNIYAPTEEKIVATCKSKKIFLATDSEQPSNTVVIEIEKNTYWYVNWTVVEFKTCESILSVNSPTYGNGVVYTTVTTKNYIYLLGMDEFACFKKLDLPARKPDDEIYPYEHFYDLVDKKKYKIATKIIAKN